MVTLGSQLSEAGICHRPSAPSGPAASTTILEHCRTGGVRSSTCTANSQLARLPALSRVRHSTSVVPTGKVLPDAGTHAMVRLRGSHSFVATALKVTCAPCGPSQWATILDGQRIATQRFEAQLPHTVTGKLHMVCCTPVTSVALHTTWLVPIGNTEPEGGVHERVKLLAQLSANATAYETGVPDAFSQGATICSGHSSFGRHGSSTVMFGDSACTQATANIQIPIIVVFIAVIKCPLCTDKIRQPALHRISY